MSGDTSWKEALLSSGLPLEATVARMLTEVRCVVLGQHEFTVLNQDKTPVQRSVDILGMWNLPAIDLQLLVECKYRREGIQWFFVRSPHKHLDQQDWSTNCLVSLFIPPWYVDQGVVIPPVVHFGHHPPPGQHVLPIAIRGVQLAPGGTGKNAQYKSGGDVPIKKPDLIIHVGDVYYAGTEVSVRIVR